MKSWPFRRDFAKPLPKGQPFNKGSPSFPPKHANPSPSFPQKKQKTKHHKETNPHKTNPISDPQPQGGVLSAKALDTLLRGVQIAGLSPWPSERQTSKRRRRSCPNHDGGGLRGGCRRSERGRIVGIYVYAYV